MQPSANDSPDAVETVIIPPTRDLGDGFQVRRSLPAAERRMVGPFVFFDQMGPVMLRGGQGLDVRPHPHIGLATVTYLFDGEIVHRDSLGVVQPIRPGAVNWMTAGRGIVHSERSGPEARAAGGRLYGIQTWVALPASHEETDPDFAHHPTTDLPETEGEGVRLRLVAGSLMGLRSPVRTFSELFYADAQMEPGARLPVAAEHEERAAYVLEGSVRVSGSDAEFEAGRLLVLRGGVNATITAGPRSRIMLLGGASMDGPRRVWWNFVSSSADRIEQAKEDWRHGRFPQVPEETESIPLPEAPKPGVVRYP